MNFDTITIIRSPMYQTLLAWTALMIFQMYYIKIYIENWRSRIIGIKTEHMQWNIENKSLLNKKMTEDVISRLKKLDELDYDKWLDYNNKHIDLLIEKYRYNVYVFEYIRNPSANYGVKDNFILRAAKVKELLGLPYNELIKQANYTFLFSIFSPNPDFLSNIYNGPKYKDGVNVYSYFTVDENVNRPVKANVIAAKFKKIQDGQEFSGVIYIPYSLVDIEEQYANKYYDFMSRTFIIIINISILLITLLLRTVSKNDAYNWIPYLFLFSAYYYLISFMDTIEGITDVAGENDRTKEINDGVLSISFLAAVNIFIVQSIRDSKISTNAYIEATTLFMVGLTLLLVSLYKITNYNRIDELRAHRVIKQFSYNASVYVNIFILIYYSFYVIRRSDFRHKFYSVFNKLFVKK